MTWRRALPAWVVPAVVLGGAGWGCGGGPVPGRSLTQSGNTLLYEAHPDGYSGSDRFTWSVTAQSSYVRFDGTLLTGGTVRVTMLDAKSLVVFDATLSKDTPPTNGPTRAGTEGGWQVRVDYDQAVGTLKLDAEGSR